MTIFKPPVMRFAVFGIFLAIGLWMAGTIHDPFQHSESNQSHFTFGNPTGEQYRVLLIVVDKLTNKPTLQSAWWIGSRSDMPTAMVSIYPNITQQTFRDSEINQVFHLRGLWSSRKPGKEFLGLLNEWDIHWDDYLIVDQAVQAEIIDHFGGVTIDGLHQSGKEVSQKIKTISNSSDQLKYQSRLWSTLCSLASREPESFSLSVLPLNLANHILTSLKNPKEGPLILFPSQPTFPVCLVNAGLMEAAFPPVVPTK